jgi:hypothetical protein
MTFSRALRSVCATLVLLGSPVSAQDSPALTPASPVGPGAMPVPVPLPVAGSPDSAPAAGLSVPAPVPPPPACDCGSRHGMSRWWWHKTRCKRKLQECAVGYPEEFNEWPLGQALYAHGRTQVANGLAARMVFYDYDFQAGTNKLNLSGQDKLKNVMTQLPTNFFPVIVERTPYAPELGESRQSMILAELARGPFPVPPERVVVGRPIANGLSGVESPYIFSNLLGQTAARGGFGGAPVGGVGLDASGLSGSAIASPGR